MRKMIDEIDEMIEEIDDNITLPVMRQDRIQTDMLPNILVNKIPKQPEERIEEYEGLLKLLKLKLSLEDN